MISSAPGPLGQSGEGSDRVLPVIRKWSALGFPACSEDITMNPNLYGSKVMEAKTVFRPCHALATDSSNADTCFIRDLIFVDHFLPEVLNPRDQI